jgi:hypothetical protein
MSDRYNIYKWLRIAFSEQVDSINESFYFDRRDNEFFSVFVTDYFLTDPLSTETYPGNPYSAEELDILAKRIQRIEDNDAVIISIPRLTIDERRQMMQAFVGNRPDLSNKDDLQKIIEAENGRTSLNFNNLLQDNIQKEWKQFVSDFIEQKADTFCNLLNINLDTASLWTDKKMLSMSFDLGNNGNEQKSEPKKPWWKLW